MEDNANTAIAVTAACLGMVVYTLVGGRTKSADDEESAASSKDSFLTYTPYEPPATIASDFKVIKAMWFAKITGTDLQERLDSFYKDQADLYDSYRFRMLHGRPKMLRAVAQHVRPASASTNDKNGITWVDLACGTGANTENFTANLTDGRIQKVYLVDLCRPLCEVARRERGEKYGHDKVHVVHGDVTDPNLKGLPEAGTVDLVTISYSMVMIPDWKACLANAKRLLKKGGVIGIADFTVAPDEPQWSKSFWTSTFEKDHVFLSPEHLPYLKEEFTEVDSAYGNGTLPYTPFFLKPSYYYFVGKKE